MPSVGPVKSFSDSTAADVMTRSVVTLSPESDLYSAVETLLKHRISGAPVVDAEGRLVGILSEKDCLRVAVASTLDGLPEGSVASYMTREVEAITSSSSLYDIVHRFLRRTFRRLPVVDESGRVIGLVSRRDVLVAIQSIQRSSSAGGAADGLHPEAPGVDSAMRAARSLK